MPARPVPPSPALTHRAAAVVQQVVVPAVIALDLPRDALLGSCKRSDPLGEHHKHTKRAPLSQNYIYIVIFSHILS